MTLELHSIAQFPRLYTRGDANGHLPGGYRERLMSLLFPSLMTTFSGTDDSAVLRPSETEHYKSYKSCLSPVLEPVG